MGNDDLRRIAYGKSLIPNWKDNRQKLFCNKIPGTLCGSRDYSEEGGEKA